MLKKSFWAIAALVCAAQFGAVEAVLPPLWEDVREIQAILDDHRLGDLLESGEAIEKIRKFSKGWLIVTNKGKLPVYIHHLPQSMPGKGEIEVLFGKVRR
jgi:hypothetical protein